MCDRKHYFLTFIYIGIPVVIDMTYNSSIPNYNRDSYTNDAETNCRKYSDITARILILLQGKYDLFKTLRDPVGPHHYLAPCNFS